MRGPDGYFDERIAARYDEAAAEMFDSAVVAPIVDFLAELAGDGRALEFGVGTGRIALPLAQRGVSVHGIDMSNAMVDRLRTKPGGDGLGVTIGDFAATRVDGSFSLVYVVFNTIMNLRTQSAQVACFRNAANHLEPRGCFVVEVMVPELQRLPPGERHQVFKASENYWGIDQYDVVTQYGAAVAELEATMGNEFPPELVAMMGRLSRHTATPDVAVTIERIYTETDVRAILPSVSAPPLSCSPHGWKRPNMWPR